MRTLQVNPFDASPRRHSRLSSLVLVEVLISVVVLLVGSVIFLLPPLRLHAATANADCTLIVPADPLTARGLATPYQLTATDPANGPCHESNPDQSAFVQAAILDPANGKISVYSPLVIDAGTQPLVVPTPPQLPANAVVGIWGGGNDNNTTLQGIGGQVVMGRKLRLGGTGVQQGNCVNGVQNSVFGQFWYCNAVNFFRAAKKANVQLPALGMDMDGMPCPTVRDFFVVDQDQSDNVQTTYLDVRGQIAQNTAANSAANPGATVLKNPSDNRLLTNAIDPALGCKPAMAPDLADNGNMVPALALDELQAAAFQQPPVALVPLGDPMVQVNGNSSPEKDMLYRVGVDQTPGIGIETKTYCTNMNAVAPTRLAKEAALLAAAPSPLPNATNLLTFMGGRFTTSFEMLKCQTLTGMASRVSVLIDDQGITNSVMVDGKVIP